jgi:hypothetical protein
MTVSPTQLSLRHLRAEGWTVDVCERWVPSGTGQVRKDLFGMIDLVALRGHRTMGVQTTSHTNVAARLAKIRDLDHAHAFNALSRAGWIVVVHGWRKSSRDGHACKHGSDRCACRWTLHRMIPVNQEVPLP